jgi:hypothetical protein
MTRSSNLQVFYICHHTMKGLLCNSDVFFSKKFERIVMISIPWHLSLKLVYTKPIIGSPKLIIGS